MTNSGRLSFCSLLINTCLLNLLCHNLVRFINSDTEIAKSRDQLSKVSRSPKESIFLPVRSIQNYLSRILTLTFPTLQDDQIRNRTDFLVTWCISNLISTEMSKKLQQHLLYKSSLGEKISIDNQCSFVESNEDSASINFTKLLPLLRI